MKIPSLFAARFPSFSAKLSLLFAIPLRLGPAAVSTTPSSDSPFAFNNTGSLTTARFVHTATLLLNGNVLVAGGSNGSSVLTSAELYDPASGTWAATGSLTTARHFHSYEKTTK